MVSTCTKCGAECAGDQVYLMWRGHVKLRLGRLCEGCWWGLVRAVEGELGVDVTKGYRPPAPATVEQGIRDG